METAVPVGCVVLDVAVAQCKLGTPCNGRLRSWLPCTWSFAFVLWCWVDGSQKLIKIKMILL